MALFDSRFWNQFTGWRGAKVIFGPGFQPRLVAFSRQQENGLVRGDFGGDPDLASHARFPITWNHVIDKEPLRIKELEHVRIEKAEQLF
ncbi:MAG: hypothetical protein M3Z96_02870 [Pseudomonadota bacterium]|nr:hypothetical protein [Pseudomonadota bacterium]